ncbi:MAG: metallophosphoesterase [Planctomycetales bacterium]|nr:metallophosphoesterase [Planctomycetales bacterium]
MRYGILADIHEDVEGLVRSIELLEERAIDRYLMLGDVYSHGDRVEDTVARLLELSSLGVWGNHELGLSVETPPDAREKYSDAVVDYFQSLQASLVFPEFRVTHSLPTVDPTDPTEFYLADPPSEAQARRDVFDRFPDSLFLLGHFHRWEAYDSRGALAWDGSEVLRFDENERYIVVIDAVMAGNCAVLDTEARQLEPIRFR